MKKLALLFSICFLMFSISKAQDNNDLNQTLNNLSMDAAKAYVNPIISAFGSNLNSGWASNVPQSKIFGLDIELKILAQASFFPNDAKSFSSTGSFRLTSSQADDILANSTNIPTAAKAEIKNQMLSTPFQLNIAGPTIIGSKTQEVKVSFPSKTFTTNYGNYTVLGSEINTGAKGIGDEMPALPFAAVQLNVGTVYGTNVSVRFIPEIPAGDLGKFSFYGVGVMHNPAMFLPFELPVDLGVGAFYQKMELGTTFKTTATQFGLFASREFGSIVSITPYAGLTMESATTTLSYDYTYDTQVNGVVTPVKLNQTVELKANNGVGFTVGAKIHLVFLNIIADYKMADQSTINGGISFSF